MPLWASALATTMLVQTVGAFILFAVPVIGPVLTEAAGLPGESIGYLSSLSALGVCWLLSNGVPMLAQYGPVRMLQIGLVLGVLGFAAICTAWWPLAVLGAVVMGFGYATNNPASSEILVRTAPAQNRVLVFSLKQAGVPLGAMLTGLIVAPLVGLYGLPGVTLLMLALGLIALLLAQPARLLLDPPGDRIRTAWFPALFSWRVMRNLVSALALHPSLPMFTALGLSFAILQACLTAFLVTYMVTRHGFSLAEGGLIAATLQGANLIARITLGWLADRIGNAQLQLAVQGFLAAAALAALALHQPVPGDPVTYALVALAGFTGTSWNGLHIAESARLSPPGRVGEVTSAVNLFGFVGSVSGPILFALLVQATGSYAVAFLLASVQLCLVCLLALRRITR